jgi:guanylate kinase
VVIVVSGPGGVGKGTVTKALVVRDPKLWLSRSWTTRARRPGEPTGAYVFVDRPTFEARAAEGGFLEHAEFLGNLYGTPWPETDDLADRDLVLEIDVQGAEQVRARMPDALLVFLLAPSRQEQLERLQGRGDPPDKVEERLAVSAAEIDKGYRLGAELVVNRELNRTVDELIELIDAHRR